MESTFNLLRVRGIPIGVNWTWLIIFALIAWSLGAALFPRTYPGLDDQTYLWMGLAAAVIFFLSVLLHELGHAFRALKEGMEIEGITLWLFGGVAKFRGMFPSAGAEFRIAIAGPLVTLGLAGLFGLGTWMGNEYAWPDPFLGVIDYLFRINLILLGFNMVPALPLDGGRVLRSYLWHRQQSFAAATMSAAKAGRAFGISLIVIGVLGFMTGAGIGGIWFAFIGWFLLQAAQAEASFALLRQALRGVRVRDLMTRDPATVPPSISIDDFLDEVARQRGHSTYPVVEGGQLQGLVSLRLAGAVPRSERMVRRVHEVMLSRDQVPVLDPNVDVLEAIPRLQEGPGRAVVLEDGHIAGILSVSDVARTLELEQVRGAEPAQTRRRGPGPFVWLLVAVMILGAAGFLYRPPVATVSPGEALDVLPDVSIEGAETYEPEGEYLLTAVRVQQPNGIGLLLAMIRGEEIVSIRAVIPEGVDPERFLEEQRELFRQSQIVAAAAGARAAGMEVDISGTGARVIGTMPRLPAAEVLEEGDVIVAVNGEPVELINDVQRIIRARPAGTVFTLTVERNGVTDEVEVRSAEIGPAEGDVGIGVLIQTRDLDFDLPFTVEFAEREIGGPSAGITYALAVYDLITPEDLSAGRTIAATGVIDAEGRVASVGGLDAKAAAAVAAGAEVFLVPAAEVADARRPDLQVRGVATLQDALDALRATA